MMARSQWRWLVRVLDSSGSHTLVIEAGNAAEAVLDIAAAEGILTTDIVSVTRADQV